MRAGARSAFSVENLVAQGIAYGITILVTLFIGVRYDLRWWAWLLVALAVLLIVGAIVLSIRKPRLQAAGGSIEPVTTREATLVPLWGPRPDAPAEMSDDGLREEAGRLARELLKFRQEHAKALPPLEWIVVPGDPEKLEAFKNWRERDAIETYERVFQERVAAVYEEMVRRRGYGHPQMDGRYDSIEVAGEINTVAHALEDMANPEPERPGQRED